MSLEKMPSAGSPSPEPSHVPFQAREFDVGRSRETAESMLTSLEAMPEFEEYTDITAMYHSLTSAELIVRREDPQVLLHSVTSEEPLEIQFVGGSPYANSVAWNPSLDGSKGMDNAFLEGYSHEDRIVTVFGFTKPEGFYFEKLPESKQEFGGLDRTRVSSAAGFIPTDAIEFITLRIPIQSFSEARMTEEEKDRAWDYEHREGKAKPEFIFRGFKQNKKPRPKEDAA